MRKASVAVMSAVMAWACFSRGEAVVTEVRRLIAAVVTQMPEGGRDSPEYVREFGFPYSRLAAYEELVGLVTNKQEIVWSNFCSCATNDLARMTLLATWWGGNDDLYISGLSRCLDLATSGVVTRDEFDWYRTGHRNIRRGNILALRYDEPVVSGLVSRVYGYTGETNVLRRIVSGEARLSISNYLEEVSHVKSVPRLPNGGTR